MKTVGHKIEPFVVTGVKPGQPEDAFFDITEKSFEGKWKVIVYYPKDFTFVCPTEIVAYDKLTETLLTATQYCSQDQQTTSSAKSAGKMPTPI
jgi:alkyl hydroperoxide reductase subunit AhpC